MTRVERGARDAELLGLDLGKARGEQSVPGVRRRGERRDDDGRRTPTKAQGEPAAFSDDLGPAA